MKIERINKIKGYRIFHDFSWSEDLSNFSRFNLIYGWNASGKTTLSNLFTYLQDRKDISDGDVRVQVDGKVLKGSDISSSVIPQVRVFNRDTIDRSLFEVPNHELPPVYYLGEDSVEKQKRVKDLKDKHGEQEQNKKELQKDIKKETDALNNFCTNKAAEIKNLLTSPGGGLFNNYNRDDFKKSVNSYLEHKKNPDILSDEEHTRCISTKDGMAMPEISSNKIILPDYAALLNEVSDLLKKSVLSKVLTELVDQPDVASWVQSGLPLHTDKNLTSTCHFCKQSISTERIEQIEAHFSDELTNFQKEIDVSILKIEQCKEKIKILSFPEKNLLYSHLRENYAKAVSTWDTTKLSVDVYLDALLKALSVKRGQPFKEMDISNYVTVSDLSETFVLNAFNKIYPILDQHNSYGQNFNAEVAKSKELLAEHCVSIQLCDYATRKNKISNLGKNLDAINSKISSLTTEIKELEKAIREHVLAGEELNNEMAAYLGLNELKFEAKDSGYIISRNGHPAMNLSEGERTAIAFMYFLKTLEDTNFDKSKGIIVIDDPISSLDANSMYSAFGFMRDRTKGVNQLFVLTHNFTFFRHVRKWFFEEPKLPTIPGHQGSNDYRIPSRFYMLDTEIKDGKRTSYIKNIDPLLKDYESEYHYLFKKVHNLVLNVKEQKLEHYYGLPNIARRLLESFLTFKLPNDTAGSIGKKLDELDFDSAKKNRILRFLNVHSHYDQVGAPEHDLSLLSEAPAVLKDVMDLIEAIDLEHYAGMEKLCSPKTN